MLWLVDLFVQHKGGDTPSPEKLQHSTSVYDEELQSKIEENARLHSQVLTEKKKKEVELASLCVISDCTVVVSTHQWVWRFVLATLT